MALSNEEQRLLDQMEAALAAEDPKLENTLRGTGIRRLHRRRAAVSGVAFFAGLTLLIVGMSSSPPLLSILGFVVMVAAAVTAIYSWQHVSTGDEPPKARTHPAGTPGGRGADSQGFMDKMEERWRRRRDEGL